MKIQLGLLYGGKSAEHAVSLQTALAVIKALNKGKYDIHPIYITEQGQWMRGEKVETEVPTVEALQMKEGEVISPLSLRGDLFGLENGANLDVIFPLLHGPNGEDGTVQGLLELMNLPYVGNGVLASAAGMDKVAMKDLFAQAGLKQANYVSFIRRNWEQDAESVYQKVEQELGYPCFVKPANLGSSVGISKAKDREGLVAAFEEAFLFDRKIIVEENIVGREVEVGVMGNDNPQCSVIGEILPKKDFYDYKSKYIDGDTGLAIPANMTEEEQTTMKEQAIMAYQALDCAGLCRADFFLTKEGEFLINEINTMPGFTPYSMFPMLWQEAGMTYEGIIEKLISLAIERYEEKQKIKFTM